MTSIIRPSKVLDGQGSGEGAVRKWLDNVRARPGMRDSEMYQYFQSTNKITIVNYIFETKSQIKYFRDCPNGIEKIDPPPPCSPHCDEFHLG